MTEDHPFARKLGFLDDNADSAYQGLAGHCAHQICQTLGYPTGSWGLSQKIFQTNFDLHSQIKWINQPVVLNG